MTTLTDWMPSALGALTAAADEPPQDPDAVVMVDDGDVVTCCAYQLAALRQGEFLRRLNELLLDRPHRFAAMGMRIMFSPSASPLSQSWLVVGVGPGASSLFLVKRDEDRVWLPLSVDVVPWVAITAGAAIRLAIQRGEPLDVHLAEATSMFQSPRQRPDPPLPPGVGD